MTVEVQEGSRIAVIGLAGRFPESDNVEAYWDLIKSGGVAIKTLEDEALRMGGVSKNALEDPFYVKASAQASGLDLFVPEAYGMTPREAVMCDPQTRLLLQMTYDCFLDAGTTPSAAPDTAVYVSAGHSRYVELFGRVDWRSTHGASVMTGTNLDYASSLIAYKFGFRGAAVTVQTACSSSLVAVHQACQALATGQCDQALAGGANVLLPLHQGYRWESGGPASRSGHCRPFDAAADGTVFGSGGAIVLLKRLEDARADGDIIHAVLEGSAINNDAADKTGFTAPSARGQAAAIAEAMMLAGVTPDDIGMIEAHGTGTILGDPIEWQGLRRAFDLQRRGGYSKPCPVTAVKSNIGHLGHAAGIASLVKGVLAVERGVVPPVASFENPNPSLTGLNDDFFLPVHPSPLDGQYCGVSSFGVGGTNAHVIVGPGDTAPSKSDSEEGWRRPSVLMWSAANETVRDAYRRELARTGAPPEALGATLSGFASPASKFRAAVVAAPEDQLGELLNEESGAVLSGERHGGSPRIMWVFPGEDSLPDEGIEGLWQHHSTKGVIADWQSVFDDVDIDLADCCRRHRAGDRHATVREPLAVVAAACLAEVWAGVSYAPEIVSGTGIGELVAALVAGLLEPPDVARIVAARVAKLDSLPVVDRLVIAESYEFVTRRIAAEDSRISVIRSDLHGQTVLSAIPEVITDLEAACTAHGLRTKRISGVSAAGSAAAASAATAVSDIGVEVKSQQHEYPRFVGTAITSNTHDMAEYWAELVVCASDESRIVDEAKHMEQVLEVGAGHDLTSMLSRQFSGRAVASLEEGAVSAESVANSILGAVAKLWVNGCEVKSEALEQFNGTCRTRLPALPVHGARHWPTGEEAGSMSNLSAADALPPSSLDVSHGRLNAVIWTPVSAIEPEPAGPTDPEVALVLASSDARSRNIAARIAGTTGEAPTIMELSPGETNNDLHSALENHFSGTEGVIHVVHALALSPFASEETLWDQWNLGFLSIATVASAAHRAGVKVRLTVLSTQGIDISGDEPNRPGLAAIWPLVQTLVSEGAVRSATFIDVSPSVPIGRVPRPNSRAGARAVAVRRDGLWHPARNPIQAGGDFEEWEDGGTYLVTGGKGALAGLLCKQIATLDPKAQIVLLGRSDRAPTEAHLDAMRLGATLRTVICDIADAAAVSAVVEDAVTRHGRLRGVFHLAGSPGSGVTAIADVSSSDVVRAKVEGTAVLLAALAQHEAPEIIVGFSSRAALDGQPGGADYAAANAVMAALISRADAGRTLSVAWPAWNELGMAVPYLSAEPTGRGLSTAEGLESMLRILCCVTPSHVEVTDALSGKGTLLAASRGVGRDQEDLGQPDGTRGELLRIWEAVLGIPDIDIDADFFELGGNSLTAVELVSRAEEQFGMNLDLGIVFDAPTIRTLTVAVDERLDQ